MFGYTKYLFLHLKINLSIINKLLLSQIPENIQIYKSINTICVPKEVVSSPTEFLNSLQLSGVPSHVLELIIGAPNILRNHDPPSLCNGTRLSIKKLMSNVIEATILTGQAAGQDVFIPKIPLIPYDVPFQFKRLQFPIRLSFAMSINKAQGQSLQTVGLDLRNPCFSHGQLYVGCSRVSSAENLYIFAPNGKTVNIVYQEALH
ncbi:ATP-dependent DNA helicase [Trichonephila clavipes]|nr:ATP-dependent DNA helicase [Trichonephila clavipes]